MPMPKFQAPRGTRDLLPPERAVFLRMEDAARKLALRYGFAPIEKPMFEGSVVFERGVGEVTDVVEKELFRVQAGRGESERERWALRPEPTAGIARAYVQHGMRTWPQPVKLTMTGPMFRYDRPQAGRYRQFWQFDVEAIGDPGPAIDAEIIERNKQLKELEATRQKLVEQLELLLPEAQRSEQLRALLTELAEQKRRLQDDMEALESEPAEARSGAEPVLNAERDSAPHIGTLQTALSGQVSTIQ